MSFFKAARSRITYANVTATLALAVALTTGTAYAAATITSADIVNGTIVQADVAANSLGTRAIKDGGVKTQDIRDGNVTSADVLDQSIDDVDLATDSVTGDETAPNSVGTEEIATGGVGSAEVLDFGLSNQDVGVLFAQVAANGTLDNSSGGGVSAVRLGAGQYSVDFGRDVSACAFTATIGPSGTGSATGSINVADRAVSVQAVFVGTGDSAGAFADRPFQLVVVC
ncbi:MAG: hypothetical protein JNK12_11000 [Acidimicrobiales bacterium]|nr:hypothetical protein [Acidimicrobiales bacterium]